MAKGNKSVLKTVSKKERFNRKLQQFHDEEWNRDNFDKKIQRVENTIDTVEELLQDVQSEIDALIGNKDGLDPKSERVKEKFEESGGDFDELKKTTVAGHTVTLQGISEANKELAELRQKENEWLAYQKELNKLISQKMERIAMEYREDFVGSDVAKHTLDKVEDKVEDEMEKLEQQMHRKIEKKTHGFEKTVEAYRRERSHDREFMSQLAEIIQRFGEQIPEIEEKLDAIDVDKEGSLDEIPKDDQGNVDLTSESGESVEDDIEEEVSNTKYDSLKQDDGDGDDGDVDVTSPDAEYELAGKDVDEKREVLQEMTEEEGVAPLDMDLAEMAGMFDVSAEDLREIGDQMDEEFNERFMIPK